MEMTLSKQSKNTIAATLYFLAFVISITVNITEGADIPIEVYVEGGLTYQHHGDYLSGITFQDISDLTVSQEAKASSWSPIESTDYIDFADDTATSGFHITIQATDFSDGGTGTIPGSNLTLFGEYLTGTPLAITKGYDDSSKNLSILPNSCETINVSDFDFHADFSDSQKGYSLTLSNSPQTLITSTSSCLAIGHLRFDRVELLVPQGTELGTYSGTITITLIDGTP